MPRHSRRLVHVLASVVVLSLGLVLVEASAANAGSSWSSPSSIDGRNHLNSVSCPSASFCAAVDHLGDALIYSGTSWSSPSDIDGTNQLNSVWCASANFCAAVDTSGHALIYSGTSWSSPSDIDGSNLLLSVSCPSASFCAAVDDQGNALIYNGTSWSSPSDIDGSNQLNSVSCPSASFCAAVDITGNALIYNGTSWSSPSKVDSHELLSVSCPSASFCAAVDTSGNALIYGGSSWSSPSDIDGTDLLISVSCPSASFCTAVDTSGNALTYSGTSWSSPSDIDGSFLVSVSCPSASFCAAVDITGNALIYNGSSVSTPPTTSIILPASGASLSSSTYLDAYVSNAASVEFRLFGGSFGFSGPVVCTATPNPYGWLCAWDTTTVPNGSYVLVSEAFNGVGSTFSSGVSITVDNPPTTSILVPANGATLTGATYLSASASNAASVEFRLFGGSFGYSGPVVCTATLTLYGWLCSWKTATVPSGSYVLLSEAFNSAGSAFSPGVNITVVN